VSTTILNTTGRAAFAQAFANETLHLAWGSGNPAWDTTLEPPATGDTALVAELGRRELTQIAYVTPNDQGEIEFPTQSYSLSTATTRQLYLRCNFDFNDASTATIREIGLFMGTVPASGHENDAYLEAANVETPGLMVLEDRFAGITRSPTNREVFEFVITI